MTRAGAVTPQGTQSAARKGLSLSCGVCLPPGDQALMLGLDLMLRPGLASLTVLLWGLPRPGVTGVFSVLSSPWATLGQILQFFHQPFMFHHLCLPSETPTCRDGHTKRVPALTSVDLTFTCSPCRWLSCPCSSAMASGTMSASPGRHGMGSGRPFRTARSWGPGRTWRLGIPSSQGVCWCLGRSR